MASLSRGCRHLRSELNGATNISALLPVMPPFRQRLFSRQHASEYSVLLEKTFLPFKLLVEVRNACHCVFKKLAIRLI